MPQHHTDHTSGNAHQPFQHLYPFLDRMTRETPAQTTTKQETNPQASKRQENTGALPT